MIPSVITLSYERAFFLFHSPEYCSFLIHFHLTDYSLGLFEAMDGIFNDVHLT